MALAVVGECAANSLYGLLPAGRWQLCATEAEERRPLPRDDLVDQPTWVATRAITFAPLLTTSGRGSFRWATVAPAITATFRGGEIRKVIVVEPPVPM
jgi:hypothetical protein